MHQLRFKTSTSKLHSGLPPTFKLDSQTPPDLQTRFADSPRPSNSIRRLPPTFKLDSQTFTLRPSNSIRRSSRSDLQTLFADLHAPTFKLDSQTPPDLQTRFADSPRPSNSIRRPSRSDLQTLFADLHAPTFKLDSPTFTLRPSNSIGSLWDREIINFLSWISKGVACEIRCALFKVKGRSPVSWIRQQPWRLV